MVDSDLLSKSPLFAGLNGQERAEIAGALVLESWPKGCQLLEPTAHSDRFRILVRGRVKVCRSGSGDGREITLWLLGPGDAFDIVSLLDGAPHPVSIRTLDAVDTLSAPVALARQWLERFPAFRLAVHRYVAQKLRELTDLASDLALYDTATRLSHLLLKHFDTARQRGAGGTHLIQDLPQEELAALIGSVRVVMSRTLSELRREGLVDVKDGTLRVTDLKRLLRRVEARIARTRRGKTTARE